MCVQKDRERAVYGLKEKNLAKTYIKLIPLGTKDPDAIRLLNWKRPSGRHVCISVACDQLSLRLVPVRVR